MSRIEYITINKNLKSHIFNREEAMIIRSRFSSPDPKSLEQLVVLANMESMNAELIKNDISQKERLRLLNTMAISQLKSISNINSLKQLEDK